MMPFTIEEVTKMANDNTKPLAIISDAFLVVFIIQSFTYTQFSNFQIFVFRNYDNSMRLAINTHNLC